MIHKSSSVQKSTTPDIGKRVRHLLSTAARPLSFRSLCSLLIHAVLFGLTFWLAFALRFDFSIMPIQVLIFWEGIPWLFGVKLAIFYCTGQYHGWWQHVSFADLAALTRACVLSLLVLAAIDHFVLDYQIPRSILLLDTLLTLVIVGGSRAAWRFYVEHFLQQWNSEDRESALFVGADVSDGRLAQQIHAHPELRYQIKGFLSTNCAVKRGSSLGGIPVVGVLDDINDVTVDNEISVVLITAGRLPGARLRMLMEACDQNGIEVRIIPPIEGIVRGDRCIPLRDINIEDLLGRDPVLLDKEAIGGLCEGRTVMVTGAGGSIGSEICRQVIRFAPETLVLVGKGENRIFFVENELRGMCDSTRLTARIGDVTDRDRMREIFDAYRPDVVFHAAAHKHVPLMEANVGEAIKNNVMGTRCVADLAHEFGVERFVLVSTDKAVHPTSVMGATKHIAERYVHSLSQESSTRFIVTRFGNVLGSRGSVVPLFKEQIRKGGPITITHEEMTRFFMTIPEASQLVLQAAAMGRGGEIFVLDMGSPVKIVDLARDLIRLAGLPSNAIDIVFTGIRPGEKLYEELYFEGEETLPTSHPKLRAAYHRPYAISDVDASIRRLRELIYEPEEVLRDTLQQIVPEYHTARPQEAIAPASD